MKYLLIRGEERFTGEVGFTEENFRTDRSNLDLVGDKHGRVEGDIIVQSDSKNCRTWQLIKGRYEKIRRPKSSL